jgi:transcription termination factor Rho
VANKEKINEMTFIKQQILVAKKYNDRRDLLAVLLIDDRPYTLTEVDKLIDEFLKQEFDNPRKEVK